MSQKTHGSNLKYGIGFLTVALCLLTAATLQAATLYWNPTTGGNGTWDTTSTNLMWNSAWASPPAYAWGTFDSPTIDSATFEGGTTGTVTVGSGGISVQNIIVGASTDTVANNYTLSGGPITLTGTSPYIIGITNATDVLTINSTITGTSLYFNNNTGPTWTGGTSATQGVGNLIITSNNSSTLTGGTVYVGGYDQSTATAGCYLRINNSNALGTDAINIGSHNCTANLSLDGTAGSITLANVITLNGRSDGTTPESNLSPQIVNYAGNNSITPAITVTSGGVDYIIESDAGTLTLTGGISNTDRTGHRELVLQGNGNIVMSGPITGLASPASTDNFIVVKAGSGTVTLASSNSYSGDTAVNGGALRLQNSNALGSVAFAHTVTIAGGTATSRIELDGSTAPLSIARTITLAGRNAPSAIHLLNVAGNNSISGDISLATSGDQYVIQSDAATLTLNTITNNTASTTPRYLYLQGGGNGQVGGIIGDASGTTGALNVTKSGTGTWTLSAANTYTGATTINGGTFSLGTTGSISSSSPAINVSSGAYFDVSGLAAAFTIGSGSTAQALAGSGTVLGSAANGIINGSNGIISPGGDGTAGTLSIQNKLALGSSLTSTVKFDLASNNTPANNDLLSVAGDLSIPGPSTFAFSMLNGQLASATYKLISYTGSLTGGAASIAVTGLGSGTTRQIFTLSSAIAHEIDLVVTGTPANLTWKGNLNSNAWDLKSTLNWNNNAEMFYNLDLLTFDGSASSSSNINVTAAVQPGSMTFNNTAAKDYTITGIGAIGGAGGMTLNNGGKVIVANTAANSYSGAIQINSGTLQIGDGGADGSIGTGAITNNGTLVFNQSSNYATAATNVISGAGSLQKQGTGALTLNGNSPSFTGSVAISAGTIVMGSANALGPTSATSAITISNNAALDVNGNTLGARPVSVQGAGPDGTSGAIVSSATADQINAFQYVTLTGNTTFGGTGRWDIRSNSGGSLTGAGYNLTKVGTNMISLTGLGETGLGNIDVKNGTLQIETTTTLGDTTKTITVESNGVLAMYNLGTNILNKNLTLQGGTLGTSFGTAGTTNNFSGAVTLVGGGNLSPAVDTSGTSGFTVSGSIGGTGMLTKTGTAGTVILTGTANAWNGGTTINGGTLQIGTGVANGSLPDVVGTTITNNGTLFINSTNNTNLLNTTITTTATAGTGIGYLTVNGTGLVILGQTNSYTGNTQVGVDDGVNGYLRIAASGALGTGTLTVAGGSNTGTFSLDGASAPGGGITITNAINLDGRRDNQNLALAPHILNVSGNNTIGAISCGVWGNQYLFQSDAGKLTIGSITNNTGNATARIIYLRGAGDGEITGSIQNGTGTGPQSVIKDGSGTWTLLGGNGYTGNTTIMQGTLAIGPSGYLSSTVTQVMAGATFDVRNAASYILFGGQTLSGGGTVIGDFNDTALAIFSPGDTSGAGTLTFNDSSNTLTLAGSDYINYNISGATADLLDVKGNMTLSGTTTITVLPNSVISGRVYTVASVAGTLTNGTGVTVDSSSTRYTFTPSVSADGKKILLTAAGSNMSLAWNGNAGTWDINSTAAWNTSDVFYNADDVTFGTTAGTNTVNINSSVRPASITVNSTNDYTFSTTTTDGTGKITGDVGLVKQGTGTLILNLANDYTGVTNIQGGTLRIGAGGTTLLSNTVSSALGDTTGGTVINGGTLDTNGQNLGAEPVTVQGTGVGGNGAIVNNSGTAQNNTLRFVTLSNDTTIGGTTRWDIRTDNATATPASFTGNGYNLTKVGANTIYLVNLGNTGLGNINVNAGALGIQGSTTLGNSSSTLTVASSATFNLYAIGAGNVISKNLDLKDGSTLYNGGGNAAAMTGNTTLEGNAAFSTDNNFTLTGIMTGTGAGAGLTKSGTAILTLAGSQSYSGATTINAGTLQLSGTGTIGNVANGATFEVLAGSHTAGNVSGAGTTLLDAGTSLTATSVAQNTLTIGAGATLTIAAIPGGPLAGMGSISPVPEPATWAMLLLAAVGLGIYRRRR